MAVQYIIAPYPPTAWSAAEVAKHGEPSSDLEVDIKKLKDHALPKWHLDIGRYNKGVELFIDDKYILSAGLIVKGVLIIELNHILNFSSFVHAYRQIIPEEYDLYLFRETAMEYLLLTKETTVEQIKKRTGRE